LPQLGRQVPFFRPNPLTIPEVFRSMAEPHPGPAKRAATAGLLVVLASAPALSAQTAPTAPQAVEFPTPSITAVRAGGAIRIDGRITEEAWAAAEAVDDFTQQGPTPGAPATERTEVRVLYDDEALYVAARMDDTRPDSLAAPLSRRDAADVTYSDWINVAVDSHHDRRTAFVFSVNPRGVLVDTYSGNDGGYDAKWDAVWDVATSVDSGGWSAEFKIPFSQLRFGAAPASGERVWGINFFREIARKREVAYWSPIPPGYPGFASRAGTLTGLVGLSAPKRVELLPYVTSNLTRKVGERDNPYYRNNAFAGSVGADLRLGLPKGLTLTATLNPDFGDVEVDPAVVNLTAFETFYPEKRPFFVEGADIFDFGALQAFATQGNPQLFYSRRVGRAPHFALSRGDVLDIGPVVYADSVRQTTILGAAKVSGRTPGGWSFGVMDALTRREEVRYRNQEGGEFSVPVEPLTNYLVGRVRRDMREGNTVVGGVVTATHRDNGADFEGFLPGRALVAGLDGEHSWGRRTWTVSAFAAVADVRGSPEAIGQLQHSSARYFGRPDAGHVEFDAMRESLGGYSFGAALRKGGQWRGSAWYQEVSPGFETNDLGFQERADTRSLSLLFGRRMDTQGKRLRNWFVRGFTRHQWNFDGDLIGGGYWVRGSGTLTNLWGFSASAGWVPSVLNDRLTRGGPLGRSAGRWEVELTGNTDDRKRLSGGSYVLYARDDLDGYLGIISPSVLFRPSATLQLRFGPELRLDRTVDQYVRARADTLAVSTLLARYVFGTIDNTTLSLPVRLDWTFTPQLSLQMYAQPFVSAGRYYDYKELTAPRSSDYDVYGRDRGTIEAGGTCNGLADQGFYAVDPDAGGPARCFRFADPGFNLRSLRGNAVLRWEYRPGSTLFAVWQQERGGYTDLRGDRVGTFDGPRDVAGIFDQRATRNVLLLKLTYWLAQ
jgi:hypothetical protein